jgi:hypothetical protein
MNNVGAPKSCGTIKLKTVGTSNGEPQYYIMRHDADYPKKIGVIRYFVNSGNRANTLNGWVLLHGDGRIEPFGTLKEAKKAAKLMS